MLIFINPKFLFLIMNKRGLSAVVTTLIIILLVLVAIGIIWVVVRNIIQGGAGGIELSAKCLNINVKATAVSCSDGICDVTLTRTGSNNDELAGVKLVFFNETENSGVIDNSENVETLVKKTITINSTLSAPNKIEVTVYFEDESGNEKRCSQTTSSDIGVGSVGGEENGEGNGEPNGEEPPNGNGCGNGTIEGNEECDGGDNCQADCTCEVGFVPTDPITVNCEADSSVVCNGTFEEGEQCDGGTGCIPPEQENECTCESGYIPTDPPSAGCVQITFIYSGEVGLVWPLGIGIYFDDANLPKTDGLYFGNVAFFPTVDDTQCYTIRGYDYNPLLYTNVIIELFLSEPLPITSGNEYQIWEEMSDCTIALPS